jgi:uncharacterized membrane protein YoaK (UPF0700 family)
MLSALPAWIGLGAFSLAFAAGSTNVFVLESVLNQAATHHSGTSSSMMVALSKGDYSLALHLFLLVFAFTAGSVLSGFIIRDSHLTLGRRYGICLLMESLAILVAWRIFDNNPYAGQLLLCMASGLQNALATTYSGAVIRTTHLTGIFTDIGILFGNRMAGIPMPARKLRLLTDILSGFLSGGLACAFLLPFAGNAVLAIPAAISGGLGSSYFVYRRLQQGRKPRPARR